MSLIRVRHPGQEPRDIYLDPAPEAWGRRVGGVSIAHATPFLTANYNASRAERRQRHAVEGTPCNRVDGCVKTKEHGGECRL